MNSSALKRIFLTDNFLLSTWFPFLFLKASPSSLDLLSPLFYEVNIQLVTAQIQNLFFALNYHVGTVCNLRHLIQ